MKRIALFFVITGLMMACTEPGADDLESRVTALEEVTIESLKTQIQTIEGSLGEYKTTQEQLSAYVTELQGRVGTLEGETYTGLKSDIDALKGRADAFDTALSTLESYVNQKGADLQQWVKDYYTSLEMFNELKGTVTGISTSITGIVGRLNGLDETTAGIAKDLKDKTDKLTGDLAKCREDIDGILVTLSGIAGSIENIEKEIAALISAVQSIVVVPDYSDGSVKMTDGAVNEMRFEVYPLESAKKLADAGVSAFSLDCVETETKASIFTNIPLTGVSFDGEVITVVANGEGLSDAIKAGVQPANARLRISDGTVTRSSEYFQLAYSVAPVALSVTVGAEHISALSAVLKGKANLGSAASQDVMMGFQFFKSSDTFTANTATTVLAASHDEDNSYTVGVTGLDPDTKYLYCSFVRVDGQDYYGETMEFETRDVSSMLETLDASDIEASSAVLHAKLDLTDVLYSSIVYGFIDEGSDYIKIDGEFCWYGTWELRGSDISEDAFTALITGLQHRSKCSYKAYVIVDGKCFCGEVKSFTTEWIPVSSISISLDKSENTFHTIGEYALITATVLPNDATDQSVTWSSDNESVAKPASVMNKQWVRVPGISAVGNGTATITATANDGSGVSSSCVVTVAQWVRGIFLDNTSISLAEGETTTLAVSGITPDNAVDKTYTWSSSDESVATVDQNGIVTAISKGETSIMATANDGSGVSGSCSVTVIRMVSAIELNKTSLTLNRGSSNVTKKITATVTPSDADNTTITWDSSNPTVATVSSSGVVTGSSRGTTTITVTANDGSGVSATCEVEVKQYVTGITLDKSSLLLIVGENSTVNVTSVLPDNANDKTYTWSSSDDSVATVDSNGNVTAKLKGSATITSTANDGSGISADCSVTVRNPAPAGAVDLGLSVHWATCNLCEEGFVNSPEEFGDYYAWGETQLYYSNLDPLIWRDGKTGFNWESYRWCNGSYTTLTKYNTSTDYGSVDEKTSLDSEDDVAHVKLGGNWRMPTDAEWTELRNKCTWTWTTQNEINGYKVTSKQAGYLDKWIFIPRAGRWEGSNNFRESIGSYMSSSLSDRPNAAWRVEFSDTSVMRTKTSSRCYGGSVRPVCD